MKIQTYDDIIIEVNRKTDHPANVVCMAAAQTQVMAPVEYNDAELIKYLVTAEHHSPLEHAVITFTIKGCSRSLLAQITRQRTFSFTSASQHYQDYSDWPCVINPACATGELLDINKNAFAACYDAYDKLKQYGVPKEEARQVLPNACAVNITITADARNIMYFLRQRRCARNVDEMLQVADALRIICKDWFPELFNSVYSGPPCVADGQCNQGKMQAAVCH